MDIIEPEDDDILVITYPEEYTMQARRRIEEIFREAIGKKKIVIIVKPDGVTLDLIKPQKLNDQDDANLRHGNPALQEAWEKYQVLRKLILKDDDE